MAKRNQVTTDLRISADAQLKSSRGFINQLNKIIDKFDFGDKINNQLTGAIGQLKNYNKILEKVQNKSVISDEELKDLVKAGKEIANIVSKTEKLYSNLNTNELNKFSKEYIAKIKAQEEAVAKIKNDYAAKTGKNFDKELANYDKLSARIKALEKEKANLAKNGANQIVEKEIDEINKKLEIQKTKLKEIQKLQAASSSAYSSTLEKETKKRGYNSFDDLKGVRAQSEEQIRKRLGNAEYKQQSNLLSEINREIKDIEKNKLESNKADKAAISLAKKYKIENVATLNDLKEQVKLKKDNLNQFKDNKSELANAKQVTVELNRQNKLLEDREAILNAAKQAELKVIQSGSDYKTKASLTAGASATNRQINTLESQLTDTGIEQIANNAANIVANQLSKISGEISKGNQDLAGIDDTNKKLATQSERTADEQDIKDVGKGVSAKLDSTEKGVNKYTNQDNSRIAAQIAQEFNKNDIEKYKDNIFDGIDSLTKEEFNDDDVKLANKDLVSISIDRMFKQIEDNIQNGSDFESLSKNVNEIVKLSDELRLAFIEELDSRRKIAMENISAYKEALKNPNLSANKDYINSSIASEKKNLKKDTLILTNAINSSEKMGDIFLNMKNMLGNDSNTIRLFADEANRLSSNIGKAAESSEFLGSTFDDLKGKVGYFLSLNYIFDQVIRKISEAVHTTKEMDKDMTQIGLVLNKTSGQIWKNFSTYSQMAERLNTTTSEVTNSMKLFYQQGLNTSEVNKMVEASAIAAALGESSMAEASETLTSIINSYNLSANEAMMVTDKISQIAIVSAADFGELSTAIEKVASSAASAGLDLDHMMGYLAKMIETTREAPTNIGTALKTIVANFTQFKEDPTQLNVEGSEINKVDKALKSVGISLTNTQGEVRDLSDVLDELGGIWANLNRSQKSYLATQIAGTRQQSRFYALMNDYNRTLELVAEGSNSAGKAQQQFALYSNSVEAATNRLTNQWEKFFNSITQGNGLIVKFTNTLTGLMKIVNTIGPIGTILGIGTLSKTMRGAIQDFKNLNDVIENRKERKNTLKEIFSDISDSDLSTEDKKKERNNVRSVYMKEQLKDLDGLNKSQIKYLTSIERIEKQQDKLNQTLSNSPKILDKIKRFTGTAKNDFSKFVASAKLGASQLVSGLTNLIGKFALLAATSITLKALGSMVEGVKNSLEVNTEAYIENAEKSNENAQNIDSLKNEYETLAKKINKTVEEQNRLKEIIEEVTKIDSKLGQQLKDNVNNYEANIKAMEKYSDLQKTIAAQETAKAIRSDSSTLKAGAGLLFSGDFWTNLFGTKNEKQQLISEQQNNWRSLANSRATENNLDTTQTSMLDKYVERLIGKGENKNWDYLNYQAGTANFDEQVQEFIKSLQKLTGAQSKSYNEYLTHLSENIYTYDELATELEQLELPAEVKAQLGKQLASIYESIKSQIENNQYIGNKNEILQRILEFLPLKDAEKLFNPDLSSMTKEEKDYYKQDMSKFAQNENFLKEYAEANKKGGDAVEQFAHKIAQTGEYSDMFIEAIYSAAEALNSEQFITAIANILKLGDLGIKEVMEGTASQLDILNELGKGTIELQDLIITEMGTISVNTSKMVQQQQEQIDKAFNILFGVIKKRKDDIANIDSDKGNNNLKESKAQLDNLKRNGFSYYGNAENYGGINGNIDLNNRKIADLGDGNFGTENSITITADLGNELGEMQYIIPTIIDGIQQSEEDAINHFKQTGEFIAAFTKEVSEETAETYANTIHERQEEYYKNKDSNNFQRILENKYNLQYEGGYDPTKTTYESAAAGPGGFHKQLNVADVSTDSLKNNVNRIDNMAKGDKYTATDEHIAIRSEYAKRTTKTNIQDTSNMDMEQKINYITQQNKALDEAKEKVGDLNKNSQEYFNTTYKINAIQEDLKGVLEKEPELQEEINRRIKEGQQGYDTQVELNREIKEEMIKQANAQEQALQKVKDKLSENLTYQKAYAGFFDGLSIDNTLINSLDTVKTAYQQLGDSITNTDELQQTLASNPALIQALDVTGQGLTWNKQKLEELGIAAIDESNAYIDSRIEDLQATKATLESQSDNIDKWSVDAVEKTADVIGGNASLVATEQENEKAEATNLGISEQNWITWSDSICKAIHAAAENYTAFNKTIASGGLINSTKNGYSASSKVTAKAGEEGKVSVFKTREDIKDTLKKSGYSQDKQGAIDNINKQIELLNGLKNSNKFKKNNIGSYLGGDLYGGKSGSSKDDKFEPVEKELEHFYNYLRKIEKIEAKLNKLAEKRSLIDANNNYYIEDLKTENELLNEQSDLYKNYITDQKTYLDELRGELQNSAYSDKVYFDKDGLVQVTQTEFTTNSEEEQEALEEFMDLLNKYQDEYNTKLENENKLIQIQVQQLENVKKMYEKILKRIQDVTTEIERQIELTEHTATMDFSEINQIDYLNTKGGQNVSGILYSETEIAKLQKEIDGINKSVKGLPYSELLEWDEALQQWNVNESKMNDSAIKAKYEALGYTWDQIETSVRSTVTSSQQLNNNLKETVSQANKFRENLKQVLEDSIAGIKDFFSNATDAINGYFSQIERAMDEIDNSNDMFGIDSESLENKYKTLVQSTVLIKQLVEELRKDQKNTEQVLTKDFASYVTFINGVAVMNEQAVNNSKTLTKQQQAELKRLIAAYNSAEEQIEELEDKEVEYFQKMLEMEEAKRDAIIELKQQVHDELMARDQEEIDSLQSKYEKMNQLDNEYYNKLQQRVNDARTLREDRQQGNNIAQMQARVSLLQSANGSQYNSELVELQKQLNEALQTQADNDVNRELERIQREQQERQEDRALTISAMENVLTFKDENNWYWQEAQRIWNEGPESITGYLQSSREYMNISDEQRAQSFENLTTSMNTAFTTLATAEGVTATTSAGTVSNAISALDSSLTSSLNWVNQQLGSGGVIFSNLTNINGSVGQLNADLPVNFKDKMKSLYDEKIKTDIDSGTQAVKDYLGENSKLVTTTKSIIDSITGENGLKTATNNGFDRLYNVLIGKGEGPFSVLETVMKEMARYLSSDTSVFKYLDKEIAKKQAEEAAENAKPVTTPPVAKPNQTPSTPKPSNPSPAPTTGPRSGNGIPEVGDTVTLTNSKFYAQSSGGGKVGNTGGSHNGETVRITQVAKNAPYPIHIATLRGRALGWLKKEQLTGYKKGGYVDFTGIANVHGTSANPEAFLNAKQTALFETLRDALVRTTSSKTYDSKEKEVSTEQYNIGNVNIEVKEIAETNEVEKITRKVKEEIYRDATGHNNMAIRRR